MESMLSFLRNVIIIKIIGKVNIWVPLFPAYICKVWYCSKGNIEHI